MAGTTRLNPTRGAASESRYSLFEFMREFPDDKACLEHLWRSRYSPDGDHAMCPRCERERLFKRYTMGQTRQSWTCTGCGLHLHPTAGTIFHKSSTSLHLWFYALYLITSTRCGISVKQLERELGVTYKTAWRMFNVIRNSLMSDDVTTPLSGNVEIDETYFSRSRRQGRASQPRFNTPDDERTVLGMVERGGKVIAKHISGATVVAIDEQIRAHVMPRSLILTDTHPSYGKLSQKGYDHARIKHSEKVYVIGDVHTQTIEGFWSLVKRGINGVYHAVSAQWLQSYLDEYAFRYNHREWTKPEPGIRRMPTGELMFRLLVARAARPTG